MIESPGSVLRGAVEKLDPEVPGAKFRITVVNRAADIVDAYWQEVAEINAMADGEDRLGAAYMALGHLISGILTGTVGYFQDDECVADTMCALSVVLADCEVYLDREMIPPRQVVDAAMDASWFAPLSEDQS
jgi:hypothetical protein